MFKVIQIAGVAITMAASSFVMTAPAHAQDMELRIGRDGVRPVIRDRDRDMDRRGPPPRGRGCGEREARAAARASGLRDPEIVRVTPAALSWKALHDVVRTPSHSRMNVVALKSKSASKACILQNFSPTETRLARVSLRRSHLLQFGLVISKFNCTNTHSRLLHYWGYWPSVRCTRMCCFAT